MQALSKSSLIVERCCAVPFWSLLEVRAFASQPQTPQSSSFKFSDLRIQKSRNASENKALPDFSKLVFGHHFSEHMFEVPWSEGKGWGTPRISPLHMLELHPAAKVLHYASELFEGMKAYLGVDGKIRMFRPDQNMERMRSTAKRCALPDFDGDELIRCMAQLISIDRASVPPAPGSLYIRPTFIGTEATLGVQRAKEALLYVLIGPVGAYYPTGLKPVSLMADPSFVRSWPGGAGAYKMGSNYAPTIHVAKEAEKRGCQQVLWLFGDDHLITEVGTMNFFIFWRKDNGEKELVTPPLDGLILPGVTRRSLLDLARQWGEFTVSERAVSMKELVRASKEKRLLEVFGAGTACVVCPVSRILYDKQEIHLPSSDNAGNLTLRFYRELLDIQYGRVPGHKWMFDVDGLIGNHEESVPLKRSMQQ